MYLSQVRLLVRNYTTSFSFYRDQLGLQVAFGDQTSGYAVFVSGEHASAIAIIERDVVDAVLHTSNPPQPSGADRFNLALTVDLDAVVAQLRGRGVTFITDPTDRPEMGGRTTHLRDPDGNLIELYQLLR